MVLPTFVRWRTLILISLLLAVSPADAQEPSSAPAAVASPTAELTSAAAPEDADAHEQSDASRPLPTESAPSKPTVERPSTPEPERLADPNPAPPDYLKLVERALSEYNQGHYAEARGLLAQAHARYPNARTLRGLGMVEFELRHYASSAAYLEQALASRARPLGGPLRAETEALLSRAYGFVGRITLQVRPVSVHEPQLTVNAIPAEIPADGTLLLDVGDHFISVKAANFSEARRALSVFGGEVSTLRVELTPVDRQAKRGPLYKKWWLWTAVGLVVAGAATGITVGLMKNRDQQAPIEGNYPPAEVVQVLLGK
jgi:hypothetical protein